MHLEEAIADVEADIVYVHAPDDSHQDHRAAAAVTLSATRRMSRVLHYQSPSTLSFNPTVHVDVTAYLSSKLAALKAHASQVERSVMVEPDAAVASACHWGAQARIGDAQAFAPTRMVLDLAPTGPAARAESTAYLVPVPPQCDRRVAPEWRVPATLADLLGDTAMSESAGERPMVSSEADVTLVARRVTVTARVEVSGEDVLVVHSTGEDAGDAPFVQPGVRAEVFWPGANEELSLPANVTEVEEGTGRVGTWSPPARPGAASDAGRCGRGWRCPSSSPGRAR